MTDASARVSAVENVERRATTPIAGAIAGILFSVLFGVSMILMFTTMTSLAQDTGAWMETGASQYRLALSLIPYSGLAFLWFIAVSRQRLGTLEDQFFSTVFLGSGLLFLAMLFAAGATAGAMLAGYADGPSAFLSSGAYVLARNTVAQIFSVYALKMAAVFVLTQATLWMRTGVMPRWLAFVSYAVGLVLLFVAAQSPWVVLVFPSWVLLVSIYILVSHLGRRSST